MITEDYCSYEVAKLLKEKGFNWRTQYVYTLDGTGSTPPKIGNWRAKSNIQKPTHQMAMKWLREVHNVVIVIDVCRETGREGFYCWQLEDNRTGDWIENIVGECPTYEEAIESAIKHCLENLI